VSTDITATTHAMATGHIPGFLPGADGSDPLFSGMVIFTIILVLFIGSFYFRLHAIPEHMAHSDNHAQMQVIGILCLLALFTHNNMFWVVALLVAAFRMPDFLSPLQSIAGSLESLKKLEEDAIRSEEKRAERASALLGQEEAGGDSHA